MPRKSGADHMQNQAASVFALCLFCLMLQSGIVALGDPKHSPKTPSKSMSNKTSSDAGGIDKNTQIDILESEAEDNVRRRNFKEAISEYSQVIKARPKEAYYYYLRSIAYRCDGQLDRAMADVNKGMSIGGRNYNYLRASIYWEKKDYEKVIQDSSVAIATDDNDTSAHLLRARAYCQLGRYVDALKDYDSCVRVTPLWASVYYERGLVKDKLGKPQDALRDFEICEKQLKAIYWRDFDDIYPKVVEQLKKHGVKNIEKIKRPPFPKANLSDPGRGII